MMNPFRDRVVVITGGAAGIGAGIVVASTLFITFREQQLARSAKLTAVPDVDG